LAQALAQVFKGVSLCNKLSSSMVAPTSIAVISVGCALWSIAVLTTYWVELSPSLASDTGRLLQDGHDNEGDYEGNYEGDYEGDYPTPPSPYRTPETPMPTPPPFAPPWPWPTPPHPPPHPWPTPPPSKEQKIPDVIIDFVLIFLSGAASTPHLKYLSPIMNVLIFVIFWLMVVAKYRPLAAPTELSAQMMNKNAVEGSLHVCCEAVCWVSYCCPTVRWAGTLHAANILNFWTVMLIWAVSYAVSICWADFAFFQFLLYCIPIAFTDLNEKLGGEKDNCCEACLCTFFCSCCVNVKYALALDYATHQKVGCFNVSSTEEVRIYRPIL